MISQSFIQNNFPKGVVTLIGARPAMGKSALAISMAISLAKRNQKFIYFSVEMDREVVLKRIKLQTDERNYATIKEKIVIDDTPSLKISMIRKQLEKLSVDYIIIDYIQLMTSDRMEESWETGIQFILRGLKELAKEFNISIIVLSQMLRSNMETCPGKEDFRGFSADDLEETNIIFLHRKEYYYMYEYEHYCNGNIMAGRIMFLSYKGNIPHIDYLRLHETSEISMWNDWSHFKEEIANSNMSIQFNKKELEIFEKSDDSNITIIEASISETAHNRFQKLADMLSLQISKAQLYESLNIRMLIFVQIPFKAGITYDELKNRDKLVNTTIPANVTCEVQWGLAPREDDTTKIICAIRRTT